MWIVEVFKSRYCWIVFAVALVIGYLLLPGSLFEQDILVTMLLILFLGVFSISITCIVRNLKEQIVSVRNVEKGSIISAIGSILGFTAIQTCVVSGVCGVNMFLAILYAVFPAVFVDMFVEYGAFILLISDVILLFSLYYMKCFKTNNVEFGTFKITK